MPAADAGRALAIECASAGPTAILSGRNAAKLDRVYDEIEALGAPQPAIAVLDLALATAVEYDALAHTIGTEFGKLDGLVPRPRACWAIAPPGAIRWAYLVQGFTRESHCAVYSDAGLAAGLRKSADASIIFVSSGVVKQARPFWGAYAVSKAGEKSVRAMLFEELEGEANIRFNSVNPGRMRTAMRATAIPPKTPTPYRRLNP